MKNFLATLIFLFAIVTVSHGAGTNAIKNGLLQSDLDGGGHVIKNVTDLQDASGNSLLGGGGGGTGNMVGPNSSGTNDLVAFANSNGKNTIDSGIPFANVVLKAWMQATNAAFQSQFQASNAVYQAQFAGAATTNNPVLFGTVTTPDGSYLDLPGVNLTAPPFVAWPGSIGGALLYTDLEGGVGTVAIGVGVVTSAGGGSFAASTSLPGSYITSPIPITSLPSTALTNFDRNPWTNSSAGGLSVTNLGDGANTNLVFADKNGGLHRATIGSGLTWTVATSTLSAPTGGSGTVTSVNVAEAGHLSSGAVTTSGTVTLTRNADEDYLGFGATDVGKVQITNTLQVGGSATVSALVTTNGFTNQTLTASTLVKADANKKESSIPNGIGALTNDASGNFGYAPMLNAGNVGSNAVLIADVLTNVLSVPGARGVLTNDGSTNFGFSIKPLLDLGASTNHQYPQLVLAPASNQTNYTLDASAYARVEVITGNTNLNITFANIATNRMIDLYVNALTSTVPCIITLPAHVIQNHYISLTVTNGQAGNYHFDWWNGTDPTNTVVTGGDYYQRS